MRSDFGTDAPTGKRAMAHNSSPCASMVFELRKRATPVGSLTRTPSKRGVFSVASRSKERQATGSSGLI